VSIAQWERLEARVQQLETWAGPGQIQALIEGQRVLRAEMVKVQATLDRHGRILTRLKADMSGAKSDIGALKTDMSAVKTDISALKTDMSAVKTDISALKTDMAWVKETLTELLRRIPQLPPSPN